MIKAISAILLLTIVSFTSSAHAQNKPAPTTDAPACGDPNAKFEVKSVKGKHPAQPQAGKALVYFIEDDSQVDVANRPTTRFGLDGTWVGATHGHEYFYLVVEPGVHHLCASWQPTLLIHNHGEFDAAAHFTAEAGGVYYFLAENTLLKFGGSGITLKPLDSDEGPLVPNKFKFSTSYPKK
jgi:hypothetical protein